MLWPYHKTLGGSVAAVRLRRRKTTEIAPVEERSISISDPAFVEFFQIGAPNYTGVTMGEHTAMTISAVWRGVNLLASTVASLDGGVFVDDDDGFPDQVPQSFMDDPGRAAGLSRFEFWETVVAHIVIHGNAFLLHVYNQAGALAGLWPIHPLAVTVDRDEITLTKSYTVHQTNQAQRVFGDEDLLHIPGLSTDGIRGLSLVQIAKNSLGVTVAGERASARVFGNGAIHAGLVTPKEGETFDTDQAETIKEGLRAKVAGWDNAGEIAVINRRLDFTPWTMTLEDAQFLESRQFQIEEVARWLGIPPFELMQTEKQTSWGTGIEAQQRGLSRQVVGPLVKRIEARLLWILARRRYYAFDFTSLERPTPEVQTALTVSQHGAGLITRNEARARLQLRPVPGGDVFLGQSENDSHQLENENENHSELEGESGELEEVEI